MEPLGGVGKDNFFTDPFFVLLLSETHCRGIPHLITCPFRKRMAYQTDYFIYADQEILAFLVKGYISGRVEDIKPLFANVDFMI